MADPRDELTLADMTNDPNILRLTVRPEGVMAPPVTDVGEGAPWGAPAGDNGRPAGRLFEPDLTPAPRPTIGERLGISPIEGLPGPITGAQALGRGLGSLVSGAGAYLNRPLQQAPPRAAPDPTAGPRQMWQQNYPSAPGDPSLLDRGAQAIATEIANIPGHIRQGYEHSATSLEGPPELREPARRGAVERATDVNLNLAGAGMAGASIRGGASAGVFGGRLAKGFDPERELRATLMEANGAPPQQIWKETGMVKFADGKWAHEISDLGAYYKGDQFKTRLKIRQGEQLYLPDVIDHPELFKRYPELRKMPVSQDALMSAQGVYYPESVAGKTIQPRSIKYRESDYFPSKMARGATFDTLLHEIQHAIQQIEDMAKGSNTSQMTSLLPGTGANKIFLEEMKKFAKPMSEGEYLSKYPATTKKEYADYMDDYRKRLSAHEDFTQQYAAEQAYPRSAGENVAELPPQRKDMTPEQLRGVFPPIQMRVPMEQQFVEFNQLTNPAGTVAAPFGPPPTPPPLLPGYKPVPPLPDQAQMGGILKPRPAELELPQMSAPSPLLRSPGKTLKEPAWMPVAPTVIDPQRVLKPGIYQNPRIIAAKAAEKVAAEHPALKELFGVTRADLYDISQQGRRQGNREPELFMPAKPGSSYAGLNIQTPANEQRLIDTLSEGLKHRGLREGMVPWYVMDPMFQHMVKLVGKEQAIKDYTRMNATTAPFSASSDVLTEINRGTAANMYAKRGDYPTFHQYGGADRNKLPPGFPEDMRGVMGHAYHDVQSSPVMRWLETGKHGYHKETVKIPTYLMASGVPETGFQTRWAVPDAHIARGSAMSDVRRTKNPGDYMGGSEYRTFAPWYREKIAKPLDLEAVPTQALQWGTFGHATGVDTPIGAGKLELFAQRIWERAQELRIDPKALRDAVMRGDAHALRIVGMAGGGAAAAGGMGSLVQPRQQEVY